MSVKVTYFVHGTTTDNEAKLASGWKPGELSEKGKMQARALRDLIDRDSIDVVFCSDLKRAIDSTEIVFENKKQVIIDSRLRECNYGDLDGKHKSLVVYEDHIDEAFPNGESLLDVEKRMREFVSWLKVNYDGKTYQMYRKLRAVDSGWKFSKLNVSYENAKDVKENM